MLGGHEDALAVEEPGVPAPRGREALTLELGGLSVGGGSRPNVVDEAEGRPGDSMECRCVVGARLAVSAREGVLSVETHRRAATGNTKSREVPGRWQALLPRQRPAIPSRARRFRGKPGVTCTRPGGCERAPNSFLRTKTRVNISPSRGRLPGMTLASA